MKAPVEDIEDEKKNLEKKKGFFERHPILNRIKKFVTHPTIWRIVAIATAAATTVLTGGAAMPAIALGLTLASSFISVAAKTWQLRSVERTRLQKKFVKSIGEKDKKLENLKKTHGKILDYVSKPKKPTKIHKFKVSPGAPSKRKSFLKVLRDVGFENATNILSVAAGANPAGALAYVASVAFATKTIKDEFDTRVKYDMEQDITKRSMNETCAKSGIPAFKNTKELAEHFKGEMVDYEAKKRLCEIVGTREDIPKENAVALYGKIREEVASRIKFDDLPKNISKTRKFLDAINPFKEKEVKNYDTTQVDTLASYSSPSFKDKSDPPTPTHALDASPARTPRVERSSRRGDISRS